MPCGRGRRRSPRRGLPPRPPATTIGQERAILRLFGVGGVDRSGRPLAAEVVERYLAPDPRRLGGGIALPFAIAMAEYDLPPMELALEVAAGNVDLGLEAELLADPDRRAVAVVNATRLAHAALDRIDANRTARRELLAVLGDAPRPWLGVGAGRPGHRGCPGRGGGRDRCRGSAAAGGRAARPRARGAHGPGRRHAGPVACRPVVARRPGRLGPLRPAHPDGCAAGARPCCAGRSTRRRARRRGYVRLVTDAPALAAPDQAVVAAFERIDGVDRGPDPGDRRRTRGPGPRPGRPRLRPPDPGARRDADPGARRPAARGAGLRHRRPVGSGDAVRPRPRPAAARGRARAPGRPRRGRRSPSAPCPTGSVDETAGAGPCRRRDRAPPGDAPRARAGLHRARPRPGCRHHLACDRRPRCCPMPGRWTSSCGAPPGRARRRWP